MADGAPPQRDLFPGGFLGLKDFETAVERAVRLKKEREAALQRLRDYAATGEVFAFDAAPAKKDGGLNGVVTAAADESGNAIVAAITALDRLMAANPGDP